ncbi:hypothetical protein ACFL43_06285 [Thermodesulfobacteriota bacterium]
MSIPPADSRPLQNDRCSIAAIDRTYAAAALLLVCVVALVAFSGRQGRYAELHDYWEYAACAQELAHNMRVPENPLLALPGENNPRNTPSVFLVALAMKLFGFELFTAIGLFSIVACAAFAAGVYLWSAAYFQDAKMPLYVLLTMLFVWGQPFHYSSEYNLRFLAYTLFYPSIVAFNLLFLGLYFLLQFARHQLLRHYVLYALLAAFIFVTHPVNGSFFLLCALLMTLTEGTHRRKTFVLYCFSVGLVLLSSQAWPYYSFLTVLVKSMTTDWYGEFQKYLYDFQNIYRMGPALLGLPVLWMFCVRKRYPFLTIGFVLCLVIYLVSWRFSITMGERYVFCMMLFLHCALAWYFRQIGLLSAAAIKRSLTAPTARSLPALFFVLILAGGAGFQVLKLGFEQVGRTITFEPRPVVRAYKNPLVQYPPLADHLGRSDVVMTDTLTAWLVPSFTGARGTSLYHSQPMIPDNNQRLRDAISFYEERTAPEQRWGILKKYGATHVLLNFDRMRPTDANRVCDFYNKFRISAQLREQVQGMGEVVFQNEGMLLVKLDYESVGESLRSHSPTGL